MGDGELRRLLVGALKLMTAVSLAVLVIVALFFGLLVTLPRMRLR
jgi:hypothetical protein